MTKAAFIKRDGALWPLDDDARELMAALPNDKRVVVNVHAPRNIRHLRLYHVLLNRIVKSGAWSGDKDTLEDWVKIGVHHVRIVVGHDGKVHYVPKSIAVESMAQDEFRRFFDRALWLICSRLLGRDDWEWLRDEIAAAVDGGLPERRAA